MLSGRTGRCGSCGRTVHLDGAGNIASHSAAEGECFGSGCMPEAGSLAFVPRSLAEEAALSDGDHLDPRRGGAILPARCGSPSIVACDGACDDCAHEPSSLPAARLCIACESEPPAEGGDLCDACHLAKRVMRGDSLHPDAVQLHASMTGVRLRAGKRTSRDRWSVQVSLGLGVVGRASGDHLADAAAKATDRAVRAWLDGRETRKAVRS